MNRHSEMVTAGSVSIETYIDGDGPDVVILPSYGRDGGDDFDPLTAALAGAGYRVLRPQPRGIGRSAGPMTGATLSDFGDDIAHVLGKLGNGPAAVLGHAFGNFVARVLATDHPDRVSAVILAAASGRNVPPDVDTRKRPCPVVATRSAGGCRSPGARPCPNPSSSSMTA